MKTANTFPVLKKTVPAIRTSDGGVYFSHNGINITFNKSAFMLANLLDGTESIENIAKKRNWDEQAINDIIWNLKNTGLVDLNRRQVKKTERGWIKTTGVASISVEIIQKCNQNCLRCYLTGTIPDEEQLSPGEIEKLFFEARLYGINSVCLSGGEPLMREDLAEILAIGKREGHQLSIATNGTLITQKLLNELKKAGVVLLQISVDGLGETHDHMRRSPGAFRKLQQTFKLCAENNIMVYAITGITKENIAEIHLLNRELAKWNAKGHILIRYIPSGTAEDNFAGFSKNELYSALNLLRSNMAIPVVSCDPVIKQFLTGSGICGAGYCGATVTASGNVKPCDALPHFIGNIRENSLGNILEESCFIQDLIIRHQNIRLNPWINNSPDHGCLAYQFLKSGEINFPDHFHPNAFSLNQVPDIKPQQTKVPFIL